MIPKLEEIEQALIDCISRHATLDSIQLREPITSKTRPYPDLGLDSNDDLNFACEVEHVLGIRLPLDLTILYDNPGNRPPKAFTIREAATRLFATISMDSN